MNAIDKLTVLPPGTRLEKYELRGVLGQGGGGISYSAIDHQLGRAVVLKEHFPMGLCHRVPGSAHVEANDTTAFEHSLQAFCRESRILGSLHHPGVVPVHEIFSACGTAFLVMQYVEGVNLREWLSNKPSARRIRNTLQNLLETLQYVHTAGAVHRDIKPENIIIREDDQGVFIDFGSAMLGEPPHTLTLVGTPAYAAPEQFQVHAVQDARSDIYALGRSFLQAGEAVGTTFSGRLLRSLKKATQENPRKRFANAKAWQKALSTPLYPKIALSSILLLSICGGILQYQKSEDSQVPQSTPAQDTQTQNESYEGLPLGAPLHPIQMVRYNAQEKLIRYNDSTLPPREEAFLCALLEAQAKHDAAYEQVSREAPTNNAEERDLYLERMARKLRQELNEQVVQEIRNYLAKHYPEGDPYAYWTEVLISLVRENNIYTLIPGVEAED